MKQDEVSIIDNKPSYLSALKRMTDDQLLDEIIEREPNEINYDYCLSLIFRAMKVLVKRVKAIEDDNGLIHS